MKPVTIPEALKIDCRTTREVLEEFIRTELGQAGFEKLILGLSGGLDSAVAAYLGAEAVGARNLLAVIVPYRESRPDSIEDARALAETLGLDYRLIDITPMIDAYFQIRPTEDRNRRGNKMARERMTILYDISAEVGGLVMGTSNKSEILMGYGTLYGDLACAINPLGNLYKTQVIQLAKHLGINAKIIDKPPSADLWPGQTDEAEMGIDYASLDLLLLTLVDRGLEPANLDLLGFKDDLIAGIRSRIRKNEFKRGLPRIAELPN